MNVYFDGNKIYGVKKKSTGTDRFALSIKKSNKIYFGKAKIKRLDSIVSDEDAYPILLIGIPDDNNAKTTEYIEIIGLKFEGNNTRHSISGNSPND
ncbi:MAG TPA: hypothetical protein ACHBX0_09540 [Arsenophonus sp.]